jgi:hypothetical protein
MPLSMCLGATPSPRLSDELPDPVAMHDKQPGSNMPVSMCLGAMPRRVLVQNHFTQAVEIRFQWRAASCPPMIGGLRYSKFAQADSTPV